jgi:hypothetical protein
MINDDKMCHGTIKITGDDLGGARTSRDCWFEIIRELKQTAF